MAPVDWLTRLWQLYHAGKGCFPLRMGLTPGAWRALQQRLGEVATPLDSATLSRRRLMTELNATRDEERRQLGQWLTEWMAPGAEPMAQIVAEVALAFFGTVECGTDQRRPVGGLAGIDLRFAPAHEVRQLSDITVVRDTLPVGEDTCAVVVSFDLVPGGVRAGTNEQQSGYQWAQKRT